MDLLKWLRIGLAGVCILAMAGCDVTGYNYKGTMKLNEYPWLKGRKVLVDPGHGGKGDGDRFRKGPNGITEEEVNLRVGRMLADMLGKAGAEVKLTRGRDADVSLEDRAAMAAEFVPDLLVSVHHNGSIRRMDGVNYPCVLIWGSREVSRASCDFADLLLGEFQRIMDAKGSVLSDFSVFPETGTRILRETRYLCPGAIGEAGFFSDETHARHLADMQYNQNEAEAWFAAIAEYFRRGIPTATVTIRAAAHESEFVQKYIIDASPEIFIDADSGTAEAGVDAGSFIATLDNVRVRCVKLTPARFRVDYGKRLYPGGHALRFSFANARGQRSMIYSSSFTLEVKKGDYERLVREGTRLSLSRYTAVEGLRMLRSALSMGSTDPGADRLLWSVARASALAGDMESAYYCYAKIYHFYPYSAYRGKIENRYQGYRFPVEYLGKDLGVKYEPAGKEIAPAVPEAKSFFDRFRGKAR
jgi:N-acetylmuramoyl-L-alanine amidase